MGGSTYPTKKISNWVEVHIRLKNNTPISERIQFKNINSIIFQEITDF